MLLADRHVLEQLDRGDAHEEGVVEHVRKDVVDDGVRVRLQTEGRVGDGGSRLLDEGRLAKNLAEAYELWLEFGLTFEYCPKFRLPLGELRNLFAERRDLRKDLPELLFGRVGGFVGPVVRSIGRAASGCCRCIKGGHRMPNYNVERRTRFSYERPDGHG